MASPGNGNAPEPARPPEPARLEVRPVGSLTEPGRVTVEGRVISLAIRPVERNSVLAVEIADESGTLTALFYGRTKIPGLICGSKVRLQGAAGSKDGRRVMINPLYELVSPED